VKYNNNPAVADNSPDTEAKFTAEEQKSFHIIFPKFFVYFIMGIFIKGRIFICFLIMAIIRSMRQMQPLMDVLLHCDEAAFRRVL
jgi:hypothetical protein